MTLYSSFDKIKSDLVTQFVWLYIPWLYKMEAPQRGRKAIHLFSLSSISNFVATMLTIPRTSWHFLERVSTKSICGYLEENWLCISCLEMRETRHLIRSRLREMRHFVSVVSVNQIFQSHYKKILSIKQFL